MAERKIVIEGRENRSSAPNVPISNSRIEHEVETVPARREREKAYCVVDQKTKKKEEDNILTKTKKVMFGESVSGWLETVWLEGIIPGLKVTIFDSFFNGFEYFLFGESSGRSRRDDRSGRRSYSSMYGRRESMREREERRRGDVEAWEDIEPMTKRNCERVMDKMRGKADREDYATAEDLLTYMGFDDDDISWTEVDKVWYYDDLKRAEIIAVKGGYIIDMPRYRKNPDSRERSRR